MQSDTKKLAIIIITYNAHGLFLKQIERINKHCKDDFEIIIIDNSTDEESILAIQYFCNKSGLTHRKTIARSENSSSSHSFAANFAHAQYGKDFDYYLYLDHDCFPVKDFSVVEIIGDKTFAGIAQAKNETYIWPGCMMFKKIEGIDFSPNHELKLDTGGNNYKLINKDNTVFFPEVHVENPEFNKGFYKFYADINNGMFIHFINGSNWNMDYNQTERMNSLLNVLDQHP